MVQNMTAGLNDVWMQAFAEVGLDPVFYANRERSNEELLPWDHLEAAIHKEYLLQEYERAVAQDATIDCRRDVCGTCGVCPELGVSVIDWEGRA